MEFVITPWKAIRKPEVKALLASQRGLHYLLNNFNYPYGPFYLNVHNSNFYSKDLRVLYRGIPFP